VDPPFSEGTNLAFLRRGSTLVELAVALAVVAIVAAIGWGMLKDRIATQRMFHVTRMISSDLATLRTLAVDSNRQTRLLLVEGDSLLDPSDAQHGAWLLQIGNRSQGSTVWDTLPEDLDGVVDESQGERSIEPGGNDEAPGVSLAAWDDLEDDAIVFTPRGWLDNDAGDFTGGYISLEVVNKRALLRGTSERARIRIARSGFIRVELGESSELPENEVGVATTTVGGS
jgi:prepilin-type N-terminal cleavage/methylation domain-containing protein